MLVHGCHDGVKRYDFFIFTYKARKDIFKDRDHYKCFFFLFCPKTILDCGCVYNITDFLLNSTTNLYKFCRWYVCGLRNVLSANSLTTSAVPKSLVMSSNIHLNPKKTVTIQLLRCSKCEKSNC